MKLTDFEKKPIENAQRALKEHFGKTLDVSKLSYVQVRDMLTRVRTLMSESKTSQNHYQSEANPAYLKLVFMEQALSARFGALSASRPRIVVENEEVEKSQVVLAAQDLVDSIQKMLEDVGQMQVKELPALVDSIESEIGVTEAQSYNEQVSAQLDTLSGALKEAFTALKAARDTITGQGGDMAGLGMDSDMGAELPADDEFADVDASAELPDGSDVEVDADIEEPEELGDVGRAKR